MALDQIAMALEKCAAYDACMHVYRVHVSSRRQRDFWTCLLCCQVVMTSRHVKVDLRRHTARHKLTCMSPRFLSSRRMEVTGFDEHIRGRSTLPTPGTHLPAPGSWPQVTLTIQSHIIKSSNLILCHSAENLEVKLLLVHMPDTTINMHESQQQPPAPWAAAAR